MYEGATRATMPMLGEDDADDTPRPETGGHVARSLGDVVSTRTTDACFGTVALPRSPQTPVDGHNRRTPSVPAPDTGTVTTESGALGSSRSLGGTA